MTNTRERRTANNQLWARVLERYRSSRRLMVPRVPLVFRRQSRLHAQAAAVQRRVAPKVSQYRFALHIHLDSLGWPPARARHVAAAKATGHQTPFATFWTYVQHTHVENAAARAWRDAHRAGPNVAGAARGRASETISELAASPRVSGTSLWRGSSPRMLLAGLEFRPTDVTGTNSVNATATASTARSGPAQYMFHQWAPAANAHRIFPAELLPRQHRAEIRRAREVGQRRATNRGGRTAQRRSYLAPSTWVTTQEISETRGQSAMRSASRRAAVARISDSQSRVSLIAPRQGGHRAEEPARELERQRAPLYAQPATRDFASQLATAPIPPTQMEPRSAPAPSLAVTPQPPIDLGRLGEDVYQYIQRKVRIERERRGL